MTGWRLADQRPPEPKRINDDVVMRFDHVYEIAPERMKLVAQLDMPAWDTHRICASRTAYVEWMKQHFSDELISAGLESETGVGGGSAESHDESPGPTSPA